jgi:uncharacterized protein YecT (DUF1311 family)
MKTFKPLLIATLLALPLASAHAESKRSDEYTRCMDNVDLSAFKTSRFAACAEAELKRQDVTLNAEYNKLKTLLDEQGKAALTKAQKSWLAFRESWCRAEEVLPMAPGGPANYGFCMMDLTDQHIEKIKSLQAIK